MIVFAPSALQAIAADRRRIVVVGASGWIGKAVLTMLDAALGRAQAAARIVCFGSTARTLEITPCFMMAQQSLADLAALAPAPTLLLHLAFLTKDKVGSIDDAAYSRENRALSEHVLAALGSVGVDRLFVASSGAAAFADDPAAAHDLRLYGALKRDDEARFAAWAEADPDHRRAVIARIFNISGPFINKHGTYALASFILDALAGRPIRVRAPMAVTRGYVGVDELLSLVFAILLAAEAPTVLRFDTGGEPLELGDVAAQVAKVLGGSVDRVAITDAAGNQYVGDHAGYGRLLARFQIDHVPLDHQINETARFIAAAPAASE